MRLIECKILVGGQWRDLKIDFDNVTHIQSLDRDRSQVSTKFDDFYTDIPYKKAVDLWENYNTDKGVGTTMD